MRSLLKWTQRVLAMLILAAVVLVLWKKEEIGRLLAVNSLFAEDRIVANFSGMDGLFLTVPMNRGAGPVSPLPRGPAMTPPDGFDTWLTDRAVTALLVLKDGEIRHEDYYRGTGPDDRRISWSVAKSYLSAMMGIVLEEGTIDSLDDPVTKYVPALAGSAYDGTTILNVLQMASGVSFDEDYLDFNSDINRMGRVLALGQSMNGFAAGLRDRFTEPGRQWQYVSIDTHVIGMVIAGATGRSIPDLMQEKLIAPMGLEADPLYITDGHGTAFVLGGLNLTTRDYARFGQMFLQMGEWNGQQIVPIDWVAASTEPSAPTAPGAEQYGLQWWMAPNAPDGEFYGRGIYGQYIYINRAKGIVIAANGADRAFRAQGANEQNIAMFRRIADAM
ncbi:serine hydrolase domain-containing protein [Seohaeicola saemankumensis]|uniref:Serine hydrolase domain-containing protein n=1 Tax=Seohaeicola saemankumensis TaxID=481181 RepID=A0ABW3TFJ6_9RHOB